MTMAVARGFDFDMANGQWPEEGVDSEEIVDILLCNIP